MDELSALPPEGPRIRSARIRTTSSDTRRSLPSRSSFTESPRAPLQHEHRSSSSQRDIVAPIPRRHLIENSASQHWLRSPSVSPAASRAGSPAVGHGHSSIYTHRMRHHTSFSALFEQESSAKSVSGISATHSKSEDTNEDTAMGRRWIRWLHKRGMKRWVVPGAIAASTLVKCCMGLGSYSGRHTPPLYGDYEAQRHWMELTIHLSPRRWYTYDLLYWGLDYPPLTAYISWLCGMIGSWINPSWFALYDSRGIETENSKLYMRSTVLVLDALVYIPALLLFVRTWQGSRSKRTQEVALLTLLFQPALLLIDFGHFQYNSVMLGLSLFAMNFFAMGRDLLGAVCFVLSLDFKQMALYYAPAIGSYLLAKCIYLGHTQGRILFIRLAVVTCATFLMLFLPFLPPFAAVSAVIHPITRIFPFARGLFEDKVANFWCATNVLFKWRSWASRAFLIKMSTGLTALGFLPMTFILLRAGLRSRSTTTDEAGRNAGARSPPPFLPLLPYALLNSAMSFFLFSFQVHEKTILLPLLPVSLLLSGAPVNSTAFSLGVLVNNTAVFSMWPLLQKDGLAVQYVAMLLLWNRLVGCNPFRLQKQSPMQLFSVAVYTAALCIHVLEMFIAPPSRYPDLYPVLNVLVCTPVFVVTWLWSIKSGIEVGWMVGSPRPVTDPVVGKGRNPS